MQHSQRTVPVLLSRCLPADTPQAQINITDSASSQQTGSLVSLTVTGGLNSVHTCSNNKEAAATPVPEGLHWQLSIQMVDAEGLELLTQAPVSLTENDVEDTLACFLSAYSAYSAYTVQLAQHDG